MTILADRPDGFVVLSGEDYLTFALVALGGDGMISVVANEAPAASSEMVDAALGADWVRARELHYRLLPLMRANFLESNPIPVKTALELMGRGKAHFRAPALRAVAGSTCRRSSARSSRPGSSWPPPRRRSAPGERGSGPVSALYASVTVKHRDSSIDAATALEDALR
jgi:hypothetical protein